MNALLLSQFSYERIVLVLLVSALLCVLLFRSQKSSATASLAGYFFFVILFNIGHCISYSLLMPQGALGWYFAATAPFGLVLLVQFAYRFPRDSFGREARIVLVLTLALSLFAFAEYVYVAGTMPVILSETGYGSQYESRWIPPLAVVLFLWAAIVLVRQCAILEGVSRKKPGKIIRALMRPVNPDARKARSFALVVLFEFVNTITIALYMSVRFIPYSTLLAINNLAFLAIYVLYVVIFISSELEQLSFRFKITGIIFVLVLAVVGIIGSLTLYQFEESYDATNRAELRYVSMLIEKRNFSQMPAHIDFILAGGPSEKAMVVYAKDAHMISADAIRLWEFVPGKIGLSSQKYDFVKTRRFEEGKRYFTRVDDRNYHVYIIKNPQLYFGVAYSFLHYRALLHEKALRMIIILGCALLGVFALTPILVKIGLLRPLDAAMSRIGKAGGDSHKGDEIVRVSRTLNEIIEEREALTEENLRLKEEAKKKRPDYPLTGPGRDKVAQAIAYIRENYRYDISREGLASSVSMSPVRFGKAFKAYTGKKFGEFVNELRIEEAKRLLKETKKPISDIAFEVGFDSLRSFNRAFYHHTGMTPSKFRNQS